MKYLSYNSRVLVFVNPTKITHSCRIKPCPKGYSIRKDPSGHRFSWYLVPSEYIHKADPIIDCPHFKSSLDRFKYQKEWELTGYVNLYESWFKFIKKGRYADYNFEQFKSLVLQKWDFIYADIIKNGYKIQPDYFNQIEIAINDKGQSYFIDGRHRLAMAIAAGIEKVPCVVNFYASEGLSYISDSDFISHNYYD